jgi:protein-ribulosamine 3-kinase
MLHIMCKDSTLHILDDNSHTDPPVCYGTFRVDSEVLAKFPRGTKVRSAHHFGKSTWTVTARLHLDLPDGSDESNFLKFAAEGHGRILIEGEFNAMSELYKWAPYLVPKPHSWGRYKLEEPETYFFLSQYIDMSDRMPDPDQLCEKLARLHRESTSPNEQYGFHVTTCQGRVTQSVAWEEDWTVFFTKLLQHVIDLDLESNEDWTELRQVERQLIDGVIPRLLGALTEGDRKIKPSLIHGDLWEGNIGTAFDGGEIYLFDSGAFYAHHELEVADWRGFYNKISNKIYTRTYLRHHGPSEPKNEWDDRNRLYYVYWNVIYSVNHLAQGKAIRQV